eukprot:m.448212 g.448212  ORF g.448212 m.448212 type:complete len:66 (-) comp159206_c0_seq1:77-274(-)
MATNSAGMNLILSIDHALSPTASAYPDAHMIRGLNGKNADTHRTPLAFNVLFECVYNSQYIPHFH